MKQPSRRIATFIGFYVLCLVVQFAGAYFTQRSVTTWYVGLHKSPLTPPGIYFGIVWTALYFLMALAATRVYQRTQTLHCRALRWWTIQLLLGFLWSILFFGEKEIILGLEVILLNLLAIAFTGWFFLRVDRLAGLLILPLLLWVGFASYLNYYILVNN